MRFLLTFAEAFQNVRGEIVVLHILKAALNEFAQVKCLGAPGLRDQKVKPPVSLGAKTN